MAGAISFMNVDWLTRSRSSTLRASHRCRSAPTGSVVDFAIERKRNFRCFVRFSKKFFAHARELGLRVQNAGCLFDSCSELPPPMIIAQSRGWDVIPSM